jgi:hypothetical protein
MEKGGKPKKLFIIASIVVVVGGLGTWILLTSDKALEGPETKPAVAGQQAETTQADKYVGGAHVSRDLSAKELLPELENKIDTWQKEGFIKELKASEHEVWIDGNRWSTYSLEDKNKIADALSAYMKAHDGTPQVMVRDADSDHMLAEILGDYRDFN